MAIAKRNNNNRYYRWPPLKSNYIFPDIDKSIIANTSFYQPYKLSAKLLWKFYDFIKLFFSTNSVSIGNNIAFEKLDFVKNKYLVHIKDNESDKKFILIELISGVPAFIYKIAKSDESNLLVINEIKIMRSLKQLINHDLQIIDFEMTKANSWFKSSYINGHKIPDNRIDQLLIEFLLTINSLEMETDNRYEQGNLKLCFSHGDFCPWNLLKNKNQYLLIDWETSGNYTIGFDLFTYIFQYNILVKNDINYNTILLKNSRYIEKYFKAFQIDDYWIYFRSFLKTKVLLEENKKDKTLLVAYSKLLETTN